ncbi:hypothetical protein AM587_10011417 [Phytophthora nicotianae]|uniref:PA domain-containing protein n=1 Tax=Phytophthora nicotianae TaxID=4792 RepID=A0A0W8C5D0_PHYNI|nr:hypothetical protein AM587_10011417 [Phytophthora nicotianae]
MVLAPNDKMLGCSQVSDKKFSNFENTAVIVRRGECSFQEKIVNVAVKDAALMILVNSEDTLIPLSSLEYEHVTTAAVSVTLSDGEKLIEMVKRRDELTGIELKIETISLANQARTRLQFLVDINAPVAVYEEFKYVMEQLEPMVGTLDGLLSMIWTEEYERVGTVHSDAEAKELMEFLPFCVKQLSKWSFASEAALHASVAAAVLQIQLWNNESQTDSRKERLLVRTAARKLMESGYYSHSFSLLQKIPASSDNRSDTSIQCMLSFLKFLQGDVITSLSETSACQTLKFDAGTPSLKVAEGAFNRLTKLERSSHDEECLGLAAGLVNDTNLALACCYPNERTGTLSREFSSEFTKEFFHSLVMMGVFLDELGPFEESLRFFGYAARMCPGDSTTLELRQLLAVPVVFSSQNELDLFIAELKSKLNIFTETLAIKHELEERVVSPLEIADESNEAALSITGPVLRPEEAAYLQYTITPPTMFIGYQGVDVLPIQEAINRLRSLVYPSLTSSFEPQNPDRSEETLIPGDDHKRRRVGFISSWFRSHSVGKLLLGVVQNLDRAKFHVIIYRCVHFLRDGDKISELFKHTADEYVELPETQDPAVHILRQAQLDIAIFPELGMDEWTVLLSHHRVAPIHTIFTEPNPLTIESREITRSRLYLPTNRRLYVCPQTLMKLHPAFDEALARIVERDNKATIVLLASNTQLVWMEKVRRRFRQRFGRHMLTLYSTPFHSEAASRHWMRYIWARKDLLYSSDIMKIQLDNGIFVTSPVITLPAAQSVVHLAAGFLRYMNASDCIAKSLDEYVHLAVSVAMDHQDIRKRLLLHRNDIYQDVSTIDDWNTFLDTVYPLH